jgi:hypothetical protein
MKSVEFQEQTVVIAKNQQEYNPLPAHVSPDGVVTSCWEIEGEDIHRWFPDGLPAEIHGKLWGARIFISQLTFRKPLQPLSVATVFNPPRLVDREEAIRADVFRSDETDSQYAARRAKELGVGLPPAPKLKLQEVAACKGMSGPILWGMDQESIKGVNVCHFLRMETQHLTDVRGFDAATKFTQLSPDADPRLRHLADCFTIEKDATIRQLLQVIGLANSALEQVKKQAVMRAGTSKFVDDTAALTEQALRAHAPQS